MKELKIHIEEALLEQLGELCQRRGWSLERGLSIAAEAGVRNLLWLDSFPEEGEANQQDTIAMRRNLLELSGRVSAMSWQNFELKKDNRNNSLREGGMRSRIENLEKQLNQKET